MFRLIFIFFLFLMPFYTHAEKIFSSFPQRTSLVAKFDAGSVKKIDFIRKMLNDGNPQFTAGRAAVEAYFGLDIYKIETLWAAAGEADEVLFIARGDFKTMPVERALRKMENFTKIEIDGIYFAAVFNEKGKPGKKNVVAVVDDNTILFGSEKFTREHLDVFAGKKKGLGEDMQRRISLAAKSTALMYAVTMNFTLPKKDANNPVLKNLKKGKVLLTESSSFFKLRIEADVHDTSNLVQTQQLLDGALNAGKNNPNVKKTPVLESLLQNAKISSRSSGLIFESRVSRTILSEFLLYNLPAFKK